MATPVNDLIPGHHPQARFDFCVFKVPSGFKVVPLPLKETPYGMLQPSALPHHRAHLIHPPSGEPFSWEEQMYPNRFAGALFPVVVQEVFFIVPDIDP